MQHFATIADFQEWRASLNAASTIGFVPTMGALHAGHASLIQAAKAHCSSVVVSIFVNPLQFDRKEDLDAYPSTLEADLALCESLGADACFTTSPSEMYPSGFATKVSVSGLDLTLCGATRPGHFEGVTTVVAKLMNIVGPNTAFFGKKDFQQLVIIRRMVADLNMPIELVALPTLREADGLALSSRNTRLSATERAQAPAIYQALQAAQAGFLAGEVRCEALIRAAADSIKTAIPDAEIDYLDVVNTSTLTSQSVARENSLMATAVFVGATRLIDNIEFGEA